MDIQDFNRATVDQLRKALNDHHPYKPGVVVICGGCYAMVTEVVLWEPNEPERPKAPIREDMTLIEVKTTNGTRWFGLDDPDIFYDYNISP